MAQMSLGEPLRLGPVTARNRICIPPMVIFGIGDGSGYANEKNAAHYRALARGGAGLIIQEATCVSPEGRLSFDQLGIWEDGQIPGLRAITEAAHGEDCPILVQLHHAGLVSVGDTKLCPSPYTLKTPRETLVGRELTGAEIARIRDCFIAAALRAKQAGYDGAELHGCHGYLLCQFLNSRVNRRKDRYGDPMVLLGEIIGGIRAAVGPDFALGIRLGAFEPTLADGIAHAKALEALGLDFIDVSYGFSAEADLTAPGDQTLPNVIRAAGAIAAAVTVPVFAVNGIRAPEQAGYILDTTAVSMVDIGRSALVDPEWPAKALRGETPGKCLGCKVCQWRIDKNRCPGVRRLRSL